MWLTRLQAEWMFDSGLMDFRKSHQKERAGSRIAVLFSQMVYLVFFKTVALKRLELLLSRTFFLLSYPTS